VQLKCELSDLVKIVAILDMYRNFFAMLVQSAEENRIRFGSGDCMLTDCPSALGHLTAFGFLHAISEQADERDVFYRPRLRAFRECVTTRISYC
jgi:hypothetical protein